MSRYGFHPISGGEVLSVPHRAARPNAFGAASVERCPFCTGNESDTPPTTLQVPASGAWEVRVFPNLYPLTDASVAGVHDVIVETPDHLQRPATFSVDRIATLLDVYASRFDDNADAAYALLFKNEGAAAGQSLEHAHSQFIALRELPETVASRSHAEVCAMCEDAEDAALMVGANDAATLIAQSASRLPYELAIAAREHGAPVSSFLREASLPHLFRDALRSVSLISSSFNVLIERVSGRHTHAAISLIPRLTTIAGFELATNVLINVIDPAAAAARYRELLESSE